MIKKIKNITQPVFDKQTLYQFSQLKSFVDASLKEAASKKFENESEKIKYLFSTLYDIRDFILTQVTENSLRLKLIEQFKQIEEEEILGNDMPEQEENKSSQTEENLEQNL